MSTYFAHPNRRAMRERLPLSVRIGFSPTEPSRRQRTLPCLDTDVAEDKIKSGMIIVVDEGDYMGVATTGWRAAQAADAASTKKFYVAGADYDQFDVQSAGGLTGYDLSDNYVFETGYFVTGEGVVYAEDDKLSVADHGQLVLATEDDIIVAQVSAVGLNSNGSFSYEGRTPSATFDQYLVVAAAHTGVVMPA